MDVDLHSINLGTDVSQECHGFWLKSITRRSSCSKKGKGLGVLKARIFSRFTDLK